jgi:cell division transport system permease protein
VATVLVTVLVLGVFIPVVQATTGRGERDPRQGARRRLPQGGRQRRHRPRARIIETRRRASAGGVRLQGARLRRERKRSPEAYDLLGANPLPDLLRVTPERPEDIKQVRDSLAPLSPSGQRTVIDSSIDEVQDRKEDTDKILSATRVVKLTMGLLAGLLALASLLLVANTIRLSMYARRREVEVMKLVGATDWFIRWPFVIEGVLVGALGGIAAIALLGVVKVSLVDPLAKDFALIAAPDTMNFGLLVVLLLGAAVGVSALGSGCRCAASCASRAGV